MSEALHGLAEKALAQGDSILAAKLLNDALVRFRDLGDRIGVMWCLSGLAGVAAVDEAPERAAWLWGATTAERQAIGGRPPPVTRVTREHLIAAAREQLGDAAFAVAWSKGLAMTLEQAADMALDNC